MPNLSGVPPAAVRARGGLSGKLPLISRQEVAKHRLFDDCWVILDGEVLALPRQFLEEHPGGSDAIFQLAGQDLSQDFHAYGHSASASSSARVFAVGRVDEAETSRVEEVIRRPILAALESFAFLHDGGGKHGASAEVLDLGVGEYVSVAIAIFSAASAGVLAWRFMAAVNAY
jgi:cytochrome b involved in lipid metabolism